MKNSMILDLEHLLLSSKYQTLKSGESYKVFQNARHLSAAAKGIREAIQELIAKDEPAKSENGNGINLEDEKSNAFREHYGELMNDETEVSIKRHHWEGFDALCKENGWAAADINVLADIFLLEDELNDSVKGAE